jgi:polyphosphate kinase
MAEPNTEGPTSNASPPDRPRLPPNLKRTVYERQLAKLHVELVKLQRWVVHKGLKVCVVFEGRDGAGKGGAIKAITSA